MTGATASARERILALYREWAGGDPASVNRVAADGSARLYWRLRGPDGGTVIGGYGPEREENRAFLAFSHTFRRLELPVPRIYAADDGPDAWLAEDLGDTTLFARLSAAREARAGGEAGEIGFPAGLVPLYQRVLEWLPRFQVEGGRAVDFSLAYPRKAFDRRSILWDLNYFKYHFLKLAHVPFHEERLERDFGRLLRFLLRADRSHFLYRDFQSRNVMVRDGEPWFIDYQGGRRGALHYDPASLLYDAKADLPDPLREALLEHYLDALEEHVPLDRDRFRELYAGHVLVRAMQAMGAYGYRGFFEGKRHFLQSVPYAARNLRGLLEKGLPLDVPELEAVFTRIAGRWADVPPEPARVVARAGEAARPAATVAEALAGQRLREAPSAGPEGAAADSILAVRIGSFSYRGGLPADTEGHGGGFVFDCRALPNPGREERYRGLTGLDDATVSYLEGREEVERFFEHTRALVEAQVERYRERGFTSLTVHYGCTGGQHRSVYLSERLARRLRERFPDIRVSVEHREREAWPGGAPADALAGRSDDA